MVAPPASAAVPAFIICWRVAMVLSYTARAACMRFATSFCFFIASVWRATAAVAASIFCASSPW